MGVSRSEELFRRAQAVIPGGMNSPVRAFRSVGGSPLFFVSGKGAELTDADGNTYIDFIESWGPHILGHSHPRIIKALQTQAERATSFGAPTESEIELAELICDLVPSVEMVRLVNSGTEATMSAVRLARAYTHREKIIKFEGCYHGHGDSFLIKAGSGLMTLGVPSSPGVTEGTAKDTLSARYNDITSVQELIRDNENQIAAIIVEPIAGNMGVVPPKKDFLRSLRELCDENDIILIFDEVISGFRAALGGAQQLYNVMPDLTTLGKIIGGGLPVGAYGGKKELMQLVAPNGPVYQAGTLSGNPLAVAGGIETLKILRDENPYEALEAKGKSLEDSFNEIIQQNHIPARVNRVGSLLTLFFASEPVVDYDTALKCDTQKFAAFFHGMLDRGIYLPPSQFEAIFISAAHTQGQLEHTRIAAREALQSIR
ncbi:MAG TPA: glutamate-1-semialdehyde 2,1-aminomutase [Candidatus Kapabacteria bacterium]|nr:glutamate-1-semialdehyde 2,1-aminomutase [Candidatus Kapabacteria bacterium]